jgi:hypothetical protein
VGLPTQIVPAKSVSIESSASVTKKGLSLEPKGQRVALPYALFFPGPNAVSAAARAGASDQKLKPRLRDQRPTARPKGRRCISKSYILEASP